MDDDKTTQQLTRIKEMKDKQRPNVHISQKLRICDIHRIVENTTITIFDPIGCSIWCCYKDNVVNKKKGIYINFYFKDKKKIALHRLIYANYKDDLSVNDYIRYSCDNKGICCNINHMFKCEYNIDDIEINEKKQEYNSSDDIFKVIIQ